MPEGGSWPEACLEDLSIFIGSGITPRGGSKIYTASGVPFLRSQNVHFGGLRLDDVAYISPDLHTELNRTHVHAGDVLLNITGASIGRCTSVPESLGPANVNQHVCIIRPNPAKMEGRYLSYFLESKRGQSQIFERQAGLSREALNYAQIRSFSVPTPPLFEQRKIADILSSSDDTIKKTQAVIDQLNVVKKGLLAELMTKGMPERHSRYKMTRLGSMPEGWECAPLASAIDGIDTGWSPQCDPQPAHPGEWGVLKISSVTWGEFLPEENKRLPVGVDPRPETEVREGDLLLSRANTKELVGRSVLVKSTPPHLMASDKLLRLRPSLQRANAAFLNYALSTNASREQIENAATGSSGSMKNISQDKLRGILIALPPVDEQKAITGVLDAISERIQRERSTLEGFRELKLALLRSLLSGEIRVKCASQEAA